MKLIQTLLHWLFPEKCILCRKILQQQETDLCHGCRLDNPESAMHTAKFPFIDRWCALWRYEGHVRDSLLRYKFYGQRSYAQGYGRLLAMKLMNQEMTDFDILTFVPISKKRLRRRGYDQVQLLAESLGRELGLQPVATLQKVRHNKAQSRILGDAHRRANVLGAYRVLGSVPLNGKRILLLDDIVTTGATASECARVLLTAGAKEVSLAVIATAYHQK